jgi:hypothetical protein
VAARETCQQPHTPACGHPSREGKQLYHYSAGTVKMLCLYCGIGFSYYRLYFSLTSKG